MMRTGPVVSLQVEKFAAIYRGLGSLLNESFPENETSNSHLRLGKDTSPTQFLP